MGNLFLLPKREEKILKSYGLLKMVKKISEVKLVDLH